MFCLCMRPPASIPFLQTRLKSRICNNKIDKIFNEKTHTMVLHFFLHNELDAQNLSSEFRQVEEKRAWITCSSSKMIPRDRSVLALFCLVVQNTALAVLLKRSFREGAKPYAPATVVLCTEVLKFSLSTLAAIKRNSASHVTAAVIHIREQKILLFPALLYVVQSNLLFFASSLLLFFSSSIFSLMDSARFLLD